MADLTYDNMITLVMVREYATSNHSNGADTCLSIINFYNTVCHQCSMNIEQ